MKSGSAIVSCKCSDGPAAQFQDKTYGPQRRVACATQKGNDKTQDVRCTVCGTTHTVPHHQVK